MLQLTTERLEGVLLGVEGRAGTTFKMSCMLNLSFFTYGKHALLATVNGDNYVLYSIINILVAALV